MRLRSPHEDVVRALELPRLVRLAPNLYAACFSLMKLLPARFIVDEALRSGALEQGTTILETTSGTFGLGLAMVGALRGHPVVLVSDPVIDAPLRARLEDLRARVHIVRQPAETGGYQQARLDRLDELRDELAPVFVPSQYDNPLNPVAYSILAELLLESLGEIDCLVGCVGSGGSMCGTATFLREVWPRLEAIGVDTHGSVLFGLPEGPRPLRGLGSSLLPRNVDHTVFDDVHWVGAAEAFRATRELHRAHAVYMGPTSGAAYLVARWRASLEPEATVVVLMADEGHRYQATVYDDDWLLDHDLWADELPDAPNEVADHHDVAGRWDHIRWNGRRLASAAQVHAVPAP
jgi:S-sulfo-L-cysteine synthase (3-phospho-L-serine-dependent)